MPLLHKDRVTCMVYQIYNECCEGNVDSSWKVAEPMIAAEFCERLINQMCQYQALHLQYPGYDNVQSTMQKPKGGRVWGSKGLAELKMTIFKYCLLYTLMQNIPGAKTHTRAAMT